MSFIPGAGLKKPLNMITGPVYPDIRKGPPRFVNSGKYWKVDTGSTLMDTEPYTQLVEPAVLAVSRNNNQTTYGVTSFKTTVNAEFRPPLANVYEDFGPLNRLPVKLHAIVPRINPGTAGFGSGTSGYTAQNDTSTVIDKSLTDRVKIAEARPTAYCPMDLPIDNSVLPDLEYVLPQVSAFSGWNSSFTSGIHDSNHTPIDLGDEKLTTPIISGTSTPFTINGRHSLEGYTTSYNTPQVSASSGATTAVTFNGDNGERSLQYHNPRVSASAGYATPITFDGDVQSPDLQYHNPRVSASAGYATPITFDGDVQTPHLQYHNPRVSASAGYATPITFDGDVQTPHLQYHNPQISATSGFSTSFTTDQDSPTPILGNNLGAVPIFAPNPAPQYRQRMGMNPGVTDTIDDHLNQNTPSVSYAPPPQVPIYRSDNSKKKFAMTPRLQPEKGYGRLTQTGTNFSAASRFGGTNLEAFSASLKSRPRSTKTQYSI